jgi:hypothetical protein
MLPATAPATVQVNRTVTVTLPPTGMVNGKAGLTIVNAGLFELIALMLNGVVPVLVMVKVRSAVAPTQTSPKLMAVGFTVPVVCTQVPVAVTVPQDTGPQTLMAVIVIVPVCGPGAAQLNTTVIVALAPGTIVAGSGVTLTIVNAGLLDAIAVIVNGWLPTLFTVKVCVAVWPTHTVPKFSVVVLKAQATLAQNTLSDTVPRATGPHAPLAAKVIEPVCAPGAAQLARTVTVTLVPGASVVGSAGLTIVNGPVGVIALIVNGPLPVLVMVKVRSAV